MLGHSDQSSHTRHPTVSDWKYVNVLRNLLKCGVNNRIMHPFQRMGRHAYTRAHNDTGWTSRPITAPT